MQDEPVQQVSQDRQEVGEDGVAPQGATGPLRVEPADLALVSNAQLGELIAVWAGRVAAGEARLLELVGEFDAREAWAGPGLVSCAHWLSWRLGLGLTASRERVRVARALRALPVVATAFGEGRLSWTQVRAITRVATEKDQQNWLGVARSASGAQIERLVRGVRRAHRAEEDAADPELAAHRQRVKTSYDEDGFLVLSVRLPAEKGALLLAALDAYRAELDGTTRDDEVVSSSEPSSCADSVGSEPVATLTEALLAVVRASLEHLEAQRPSAARATQAALTVQVDPLSGWSRLRDGELLPPRARSVAVIQGGPGQLLRRLTTSDLTRADLGRTRRLADRPLRDLLSTLDGERCRFPGCSHVRFLHAHHVLPWARGGPTDLANLVLLCSRHHALVHDDGFDLTLSPARRLRVCTPDRAAVEHLPAPPRGWAYELDAEERIGPEHLPPTTNGDRLDLGYAVAVLLQQTG